MGETGLHLSVSQPSCVPKTHPTWNQPSFRTACNWVVNYVLEMLSPCGREAGEARISEDSETQGREPANKGGCNLLGLSGRNSQISYLQLHLLPEDKPHRPVPYGEASRKPHSARTFTARGCGGWVGGGNGPPVSEEVQAGQGVV